MILVNGKAESRIDVLDRGLQYGDGLFETLVYRNETLEFLEEHLQRLSSDSLRLNIAVTPSIVNALRNDLAKICQDLSSDSVIKIIVTRGVGGRGYFAGDDLTPTRIVSTHPMPVYPEYFSTEGVTVRFCKHTLSQNSTLAGIKHLNRLDQVLARGEWSDKTIAEGLMFDQNEQLIEGTMSNVFIVSNNQLLTPLLERSGVAGVMRAKLIELAEINNISFKEQTLSKQNLIAADEVFVCNSVNGIWPVNHITATDQSYPVGSITKQLQQLLSETSK